MKQITTLLAVLFLTCGQLAAQNTATPKNMWEVGASGGALMLFGETNPEFSIGYGLHVRKSLDYVFSLGVDVMMGTAKGDRMNAAVDQSSETDWTSGTFYGLMTLNALRFDKPVRSTNIYVKAGGGLNKFETEFMELGDRNPKTLEGDWAPHISIGGGIGFRLGKRVNIAIDQSLFWRLGFQADAIDGIKTNDDGTQSTNTDMMSYSALKLNFNIGDKSKNSEPLYWVNPLDNVMKELDEVKNRPEVSLEDADNDGVIDAIDQEQNTPAGAIVDTKGRTLDSDRDGVPDHVDSEPYYTPREGEIVDDQGRVVNPTRSGVSEERVKELIDEALQNLNVQGGATPAEFFLPMIHFATDSYTVKYSDYGNLAGVARVMKSNPNLRLVVTGFTDSTGPESYNKQLSYLRAQAVIEHLVANHGVGRGRFVLQYRGQEDSLVPSVASMMNRRVEFRAAGPGDYEMDPPSSSGGGY